MKAQEKLEIYNLEFPQGISELSIGSCKFFAVDDYVERSKLMSQRTRHTHDDSVTESQYGGHCITATVEFDQEKKCVLPWRNRHLTQLDDVLFLLTLFTGRNVFERKKGWITADHRQHRWGSQLRCSTKYEVGYKCYDKGILVDPVVVLSNADSPLEKYDLVNIGFEKEINNVLKSISSVDWKKEYEDGYFLFLFKAAIQPQILETSFITCWTIWEHIFAIKNRWLNNNSIERMGGSEKVAFILEHYFSQNLCGTARKEIGRLNLARNRLIHFGKKSAQVGEKELELFILLTEQLIAMTLGLSPSNILNSQEKLRAFLAGKNEEVG